MPARAAVTARKGCVAGFARRAAHRKDRQNAVADEFQHLAAKGMDRAGEAIEPGVEGRDHHGGFRCFGQRREVAQIGIE